MQEFAQTRNGQVFLNDVNRIAKALEELAKHCAVLAAAAVVDAHEAERQRTTTPAKA